MRSRTSGRSAPTRILRRLPLLAIRSREASELRRREGGPRGPPLAPAGSRAAALRAFPAPCASRLARASPPPTQLYNGLSGKRLTTLKPFPLERLRGAYRLFPSGY